MNIGFVHGETERVLQTQTEGRFLLPSLPQSKPCWDQRQVIFASTQCLQSGLGDLTSARKHKNRSGVWSRRSIWSGERESGVGWVRERHTAAQGWISSEYLHEITTGCRGTTPGQ